MSTATKTESTPKLPTYYAYQVRARKDADPIWTRIGSAWNHADGKGFNIQLDALSFDGRIALRIPPEKTA